MLHPVIKITGTGGPKGSGSRWCASFPPGRWLRRRQNFMKKEDDFSKLKEVKNP
jgi:hypothetical protein